MLSSRNLANAIRFLSMDAVQKANSGHPGAPMGMADIAEILWNKHMKYNPANSKWLNRDRFVLSNGHGSMLLYSLLHLTGFNLTIEDIKNFRQLNSTTAGHPEYGHIDGIETTTGPLGQGIANAVGMAIAERTLGAQFNRKGHDIINHNTYIFMGDGCLMEGISHEACSLAGVLGLSKIIAFWDDNDVSIDGHISTWMEKDVAARFASYGWQVISDVDGHDASAVDEAIKKAKADSLHPSIICCRTIIGYGAPNLAGSHNCHGAPLGVLEVAAARKELGWDSEAFKIPSAIYNAWDHKEKGAADEAEWNDRFKDYKAKYYDLANELIRRTEGRLPNNFVVEMDKFIIKTQEGMLNIASRKASQNTIEVMGGLLPEMFGGSADLTNSNLVSWSGSVTVDAGNANGNCIYWGVREFGMAHMVNGIVLYGGFKAFGATFLMFMEFMRNALRMSALMKIGTIYVYTHDSIGLGEDGPTHQPVEQLATMRLIPNFHSWRACDAVETAVCWKMAMLRNNAPTALVFSRQTLTAIERTPEQVANIEKGGYVLRDCEGIADIIFIATGSEVKLAIKAAYAMSKKVRVVSMPCTNAYDEQSQEYKDSVLTPRVKRLAIEAGVADIWYKYVGCEGKVVAMKTFGESAPADDLFKKFGFTVDNVTAVAESMF